MSVQQVFLVVVLVTAFLTPWIASSDAETGLCYISTPIYRISYRRIANTQSYSCGRLNWRRCHRTVYWSESYSDVYYRQASVCCSGYSTVNRSCSMDCCPVCSSGCYNGGICTSPNICSCTSGWTGSTCAIDIDECQISTHDCDQLCINTIGSYECSCDSEGFVLSEDGHSCLDVDECQNSTHDCDHLCKNTIGSYECSCNKEGFILDEDGHSCLDVDECQNSMHGCDHQCINTNGSYECSCESDFMLAEDGVSCIAPPAKPVNIQAFCNHIIWRNSPNISCESINGYDIQFFDKAKNQSLTRHLDASATFYSLDSIDNASLTLESTSVQVRVVSNRKHLGLFSSPIPLGCLPPPLDVFLQMRGVNYTNNSLINIADIGEGENALLCMTNNESCCGTPPNRAGQFYFPDGRIVPIKGAGQGFYRDRQSQQIRLNRRQGIFNPIGLYHCEIPNASGAYQKLFFSLSDGNSK